MSVIPRLLRKSRGLRNPEALTSDAPISLIRETMSFNCFYLYTSRNDLSRQSTTPDALGGRHFKDFKPRKNPMIELRPFAKLGSADHGCLKARHHFSFGSHYDTGNIG